MILTPPRAESFNRNSVSYCPGASSGWQILHPVPFELDAAHTPGIEGYRFLQDFDCHVALELRVAGAVHFTPVPAPSGEMISYDPSFVPAVSITSPHQPDTGLRASDCRSMRMLCHRALFSPARSRPSRWYPGVPASRPVVVSRSPSPTEISGRGFVRSGKYRQRFGPLTSSPKYLPAAIPERFAVVFHRVKTAILFH